MFDSEDSGVFLCFLRLYRDRSVWAISSSSCQINFKESEALTSPSLEECWQRSLSLPSSLPLIIPKALGESSWTTNADLIYQTDSVAELSVSQTGGEKACWITEPSSVLTGPVMCEGKGCFHQR